MHRSLSLLLFAQLVSGVGDWAVRVALGVLVLERTGSAGLVGLVVAVTLLPWIGIGQVLATLGDRLPRKQLMIGCHLVSAAAFFVMTIPMPIGVLLVLAFLAALPAPPFAAARSALLPETVPPRQYPDALALATIIAQTTTVLGYLLGGVLVAVVGARGALVVNGVSFLIAAAALSQLKVGHTRAAQSTRATLREGANALFGDVMVRRAVVFLACVNVGAIIPETQATVYALEHLRSGDAAAGVLAASVAIGTMVIVSIVPLENRSARWLLRAAGVVAVGGAAAALALFGLDLRLPFLVLAFAAVGVTLGSVIPTNTVAGTRLPNESRASAFGLAQGVLFGADAAGAAIGGLLTAVVGVRGACLTAMGFVLAVGLWGAATAPRDPLKRMPPAPPPPPIGVADDLVDIVERRPPAPPPRPVQTG
jgi:MFS family permease